MEEVHVLDKNEHLSSDSEEIDIDIELDDDERIRIILDDITLLGITTQKYKKYFVFCIILMVIMIFFLFIVIRRIDYFVAEDSMARSDTNNRLDNMDRNIQLLTIQINALLSNLTRSI